MIKINKILVLILFLSFVKSEYQVVNAFPNLTFQDPVGIHHSGDGTNRLFIVEQEGRIKVFNNNSNQNSAQTFLDIRSIVNQIGFYSFKI